LELRSDGKLDGKLEETFCEVIEVDGFAKNPSSNSRREAGVGVGVEPGEFTSPGGGVTPLA
jgi:hypothetical protein